MHETNNRWQKDKSLFVEQIQALGYEVLVRDANLDVELQKKQAKELVDLGVKTLVVVAVNSKECKDIVEYAHEHGVKVIAYDRMILNCNLDYFVGFDSIKIGEEQARYLTKVYPLGHYLILGGDKHDQNASLMRMGQYNILQPFIDRGDIKIVADVNTKDWKAENAFEIVDNILLGGARVNAVIAANDKLSTGAIKAIKKHKLKHDIIVSGQDADLNACRRIVKGEQTMSIYKPIQNIAYTSALIADKITRGEKLQSFTTLNNGKKLVPSTIIDGVFVLTKSNMDMTVVFDKFHSREDIYK
jgi:D-xylose transport system substrate-binding protein